MVRINLKPLSLNNAYRGRRFKTPELARFHDNVSMLAPKLKVPEGHLSVRYRFGVSSKQSDVDNLIKVCQDALAQCYGFNDKRIYHIDVTKVDVPKGAEFIEFEIRPFAP